MTLLNIAIFLFISLFAGLFISPKNRGSFFLIANILAIFWLQPVSAIRHLDFWLPLSGLLLVIAAWVSTQSTYDRRQTARTLGVIVIVVLFICILRYVEPICCLTASRPPAILQVLSVVLPITFIIFLSIRYFPERKIHSIALSILILIIFVLLKTEYLSIYVSKFLRLLTDQDQNIASSIDLRWVGFSYLAFRLLHYLRDHQTGKIPPHNLKDFIIYTLFFPAYSAGPIDRFPRFLDDLQKIPEDQSKRWHLSSEFFFDGSVRIVRGIFKKFVLADTLALISLNSQNALQIQSTFWAWIILYAYAFRIYFDFSGYTDIALGIAKYIGIQLPENFAAPYLKLNITLFWNSWHITLAQWLRTYIFYPLTRAMRTAQINFPAWMIILCAQLCTMLLIGLWHGVTINFAIWGLWHAIGLFLHNRWSNWRKNHFFEWENNTVVKNINKCISWFITFNYVTLGWVWFALPDTHTTWRVFRLLFGGYP